VTTAKRKANAFPQPHDVSTPRGSEQPIKGRCGSHLKATDPPRYCTQWPRKGRTRCKFHGGNTKRGPDSPHWKHGKRSLLYQDLLRGPLLTGYLALQSDEDLVNMQEQIRLWTARERQLVERLTDNGETSATWRSARMALGEIDGAKDPDEVTAILTKLRVVILEGAAKEAAWDDLQRCHEALRKLKEAERKKREADHNMLSADHVVYLAQLLTGLALRCITDESKRQEFAEGVDRLSRGDVLGFGPGVEIGGR